MGCELQLHEKTDKLVTWSYHLVDGWYLATSPENYLTHLCQIKTTNSERVTGTAQFSHKIITKTKITPTDKIMAAIAECTKAIKNMGDSNSTDEMHKLLHLTDRAVQHNLAITAASQLAPSTTVNPRGRSTQPAPRVPTSGNQTQKNGGSK